MTPRPVFCHHDPAEAARLLDDASLERQVVFMAQCLSEASDPLSVELASSPTVAWAGTSRPAYEWLLAHCLALLLEHSDRFGGVHPSSPLVHKALAASAYYAPTLAGARHRRAKDHPRHAPTKLGCEALISRDRARLRGLWLRQTPSWTRAVPPSWW